MTGRVIDHHHLVAVIPVEPVAPRSRRIGERAVGGFGLARTDEPVVIEIEIAHHEGAATIGRAQFGIEQRHPASGKPIVTLSGATAVPVPPILRERGGGDGGERKPGKRGAG